jgi:hypothetical protein
MTRSVSLVFSPLRMCKRTNSDSGSARELFPFDRRNSQEGAIYTRVGSPFGVWEEPYAQGGCRSGYPTNIRHYRHQE